MERIALLVIVPLATGALLTGLLMALGTAWGLVRHWWVVISLGLTVVGVVVLVGQLGQIAELAAAARDANLPASELPGAEGQVLHAIHLLNVLKPLA